MVIDGACIPLHAGRMGDLSALAGIRAARVAGDAVAALGGSAMAVDVTVDENDDAYVTRVDPAPHLGRLNDEAISALVDGIADRLAMVWPPVRRRAQSVGTAARRVLPSRAPVLRRGQATVHAEPKPGYSLTYHGSDIGVVERVDIADHRGAPALYVRGGIAGSLRYTIPACAVAAVFPDERRVALDDDVTFEPEAVGREGEVLLIARTSPVDRADGWRPSRNVPPTCSGFRVYADDGFLGEIEATLGTRADSVDYLVVRARRWLRTRHPVIPSRYVVECEPLDGIVVLAGTRRELRQIPEMPPLAQ